MRQSGWIALQEQFSDFFIGDRTRMTEDLGGFVPIASGSRKLKNEDFMELQKELKDFLARHISFRDRKKQGPIASRNPVAKLQGQFEFFSLPVGPETLQIRSSFGS